MPVQETPNGRIEKQIVPPMNVGNQQTSFVDDVLKIRQQVAAENIAKSSFGSGGASATDTLATSIVTKALENLNKAEERYASDAQKSRQDAIAAGAALEKAKEDVYKVQMDSMKMMLERLEKAQADVRAGAAAPKSVSDAIKEAQELVAIINGGRGEANTLRQPPTTDISTQISLLKLQQEHEMAMKKIDLEMLKMKQDADIKMLEFKDNRDQKLREYEDNRKFKGDAMSTLEDIAAAAAAATGSSGDKEEMSFSAEGHDEVRVSKSPKFKPGPPASLAQTPPAESATYEATLLSFPCQSCKTEVLVPEEGGGVVCSNCGAKYNVDKKL